MEQDGAPEDAGRGELLDIDAGQAGGLLDAQSAGEAQVADGVGEEPAPDPAAALGLEGVGGMEQRILTMHTHVLIAPERPPLQARSDPVGGAAGLWRARGKYVLRPGKALGLEEALAIAACCCAAVAPGMNFTAVARLTPTRSGLTAVPTRGHAVTAFSAPEPSAWCWSERLEKPRKPGRPKAPGPHASGRSFTLPEAEPVAAGFRRCSVYL
jgi:hypothetical protein